MDACFTGLSWLIRVICSAVFVLPLPLDPVTEVSSGLFSVSIDVETPPGDCILLSVRCLIGGALVG